MKIRIISLLLAVMVLSCVLGTFDAFAGIDAGSASDNTINLSPGVEQFTVSINLPDRPESYGGAQLTLRIDNGVSLTAHEFNKSLPHTVDTVSGGGKTLDDGSLEYTFGFFSSANTFQGKFQFIDLTFNYSGTASKTIYIQDMRFTVNNPDGTVTPSKPGSTTKINIIRTGGEPATTPGDGPSGTPTPAPSATPIPISTIAPDSGDKLAGEIDKGIDDIINEADPEKALEKAVSLINSAIAAVQQLADNGVPAQAAVQSLEKAANAVLAKVNTETVTATVSAGTSTAVIDAAAANALVAKLDKIIETATQLNTELAKASTDAKIERVLNIKVNTGNEAVKASSAQVPKTLLSTAATKGIDKIAIDTGVATIAIAPDAIAAGDETSVTLSAAKVDKTALTAEEQTAVGDNQVYEFTALAGTTAVTSFSKPVDITVPYTLKPGETGDNITVFFINAQGQLENVIGAYDPVTQTVTFSTNHFSKYIVKENQVTFSDLGTVEWARLNVESMAAKGIITGVPGGKFAPADSVTRAEFAAMIVRLYKLEDATATNTFSDVKSTDWFYKAVITASKAGIINGLPDGRFDPNGKVTREQMAAMVARALVAVKGKDLTADAGKYTAKFDDKGSISSFAVNEANLIAKYGIMSGKPGNKFDPKGSATRVEAAVVMYRLFNVK